jgi:hypothetical protein
VAAWSPRSANAIASADCHRPTTGIWFPGTLLAPCKQQQLPALGPLLGQPPMPKGPPDAKSANTLYVFVVTAWVSERHDSPNARVLIVTDRRDPNRDCEHEPSRASPLPTRC